METVYDAAVSAAPAMESLIDPRYEFCAPHFFDFCKGETDEEAAAAQLWFQAAPSHPQSPFVGKTKSVRELSMGCSLEQYIEVQKLVVRVSSEMPNNTLINSLREADAINSSTVLTEKANTHSVKENTNTNLQSNLTEAVDANLQSDYKDTVCGSSKDEPCAPNDYCPEDHNSSKLCAHTMHNMPAKRNFSELHKQTNPKSFNALKSSSRPPASKRSFHKADSNEDNQTLKKLKLETTGSQDYHAYSDKHANKKQKLEGGRSCQISRHVPTLTVPQEFHFNTERRAHIYHETGQCSGGQCQGSGMPYIPIAEMVQRFQMNLLGEFPSAYSQNDKHSSTRNRVMKLTRPREPMLGTSLRARPTTVKSSAELEEEMLANIPKFKARPLNKRILEAPTLPLPPRTTPQLPEFQEFNLKTMERAMIHQQAIPPSEAPSTFVNRDRVSNKGEFNLMTAARARPPKMKSTSELEEDLAMMSKFKARPLDKRIFSSRGDVGVFTVSKRQATVPKEFNFATDQRAQHHDVHLSEQQNIGMNKRWKIDRCLFENQASNHCVRSSTTFDQHNSSRFSIFNDTHAAQQRTDVNGMFSSHAVSVPNSDKRFSAYNERPRRPLGEIQQFVLGSETHASLSKADQKLKGALNRDCAQEDRHFLSSQMKNAFVAKAVDEYESYPVYMRSTKEIMEHLTPFRKEERLLQKAFPVHYMR